MAKAQPTTSAPPANGPTEAPKGEGTTGAPASTGADKPTEPTEKVSGETSSPTEKNTGVEVDAVTASEINAARAPTLREPTPEERKRGVVLYRERHIAHMAHGLAVNVLQNPRVYEWFQGDPFRAGRCGDHENVGAAIAVECHRMARNITDKLERLYAEHARKALKDAGGDPEAVPELDLY